MEILAQLNGFLGGAITYVVPFLFVLTVIVFFHELGHFLVARWCGVKVDTFSIGFGKEIAGFNDAKGTRWKLSWVPLGGYVKFFGDDNAASAPSTGKLDTMSATERAGSFHHKPLASRAAVVVAGPVANFLLAILIFGGLFAINGKQIILPAVDSIQPGSAAEVAGFKPGDLVKMIDGVEIESFSDMQRIASSSADLELQIVVLREGELVSLKATPRRKEITDRFGNKLRIGLLGVSRSTSSEDITVRRYNLAGALWMGTKETYFVVARTLSYLSDVITGRESADQLGGPLRIAQVSGQVAGIGFTALMHLAGVLSVSIGLINLFPIPMLDGGHLLFYAIEALRGRPLSEKMQEMGFRIGLAFVLLLMVFATWNDLIHLDVF